MLGSTLKKSTKFSNTSWDTRLIDIIGDRGKFFGGKSPAELVTVRDILAHRMGIPAYDGGWIFGFTKSDDEIVRQDSIISNKPSLPIINPAFHFD